MMLKLQAEFCRAWQVVYVQSHAPTVADRDAAEQRMHRLEDIILRRYNVDMRAALMRWRGF